MRTTCTSDGHYFKGDRCWCGAFQLEHGEDESGTYTRLRRSAYEPLLAEYADRKFVELRRNVVPQ